MRVGSLFSGCGLLDYGLSLAGHEHRWFCEADPFRRSILAQRWPHARVFDDVRTVGAHNAEPVTAIVGGFPCKGASNAGKQNGFEHPETVLWREMARAVGELRPRYVVVENVANLLAVKDGSVWGEVLADLVTLGFDVEWDCFPAAAFGAPHLRDRVIAVATNSRHPERWSDEGERGGVPRPERIPGGRGEGADQHPAGHHCTPADVDGDGVREQPEPERWRSRAAQPSGTPAVTADPDRAGREPKQHSPTEPDGAQQLGAAGARGVAVEWGEYAPAIARWEAVHGPAPEPLIRRVDDGRTTRVERSRLSALGDGVQVQLGQMVGAYLMSLESK